jgi:radical SAM protein with 4Fe4S-binding SPASM domain
VALMGGEPLLRGDFWNVAKRIRELGMELSVITNGTIISDEIFAGLRDLRPRAVAVSLDAASPELHDRIRGSRGAFKKSGVFIDRALAAGLPVSVITTVHRLNIRELPALGEMLRGRGIAWQVQTAGAEGRRFPRELLLDEEEFYSLGMFIESCRRSYAPEELPVIGAHDLGYNSDLLNNVSLCKKWEGCQAGVSVLGIRSDGDVLGCLSLNDDRYVEGNVREKSVSAIWNDSAAFAYTRGYTASDAGPNCAGCAALDSCKGGCCEISLNRTGVFHNDPHCFHRLEGKLFSGKACGRRAVRRHGAGAFARLGAIFSGKRTGGA